jgi:hypothetical protein
VWGSSPDKPDAGARWRKCPGRLSATMWRVRNRIDA